ncbi:unnamed protein product [Camellia sinensis]
MEVKDNLELIQMAIEQMTEEQRGKKLSLTSEESSFVLSELLSQGDDGKLNKQPDPPADSKVLPSPTVGKSISEVADEADGGSDDDDDNGGGEEIVRELREIKRQNFITHCLLSAMIVLTVAWQLSKVSLVLKLQDGLSQTLFELRMLKGPVVNDQNGEKKSSSKQQQVDGPSVPPLKIAELPHLGSNQKRKKLDDKPIPTSFDGEDGDEANQPQQQLAPASDALENPQNGTPVASEVTPTAPEAAAESISHRVRRRPAWMSDYENSWPIFQLDMKSAFLHGDLKELLNKDYGGNKVDDTLYKQMVGSLMYLTATRPDIMHAVSVISRYMECPTKTHLLAAKRIFRYLQGTKEFGLFYKNGEKLGLFGFTDSDYAGDSDDRKSTSGYVFMMGTGAISWSSKKQPIVTLSSTEAEFVAATACAYQAIWLKKIIKELNFKEDGPTQIYCDNSSAIKLSKNPVLHGRSKHMKYHFLRDLTNDGVINLIYCKVKTRSLIF